VLASALIPGSSSATPILGYVRVLAKGFAGRRGMEMALLRAAGRCERRLRPVWLRVPGVWLHLC